MVVIDAVVRLIPGVLGDVDSAKNESFLKVCWSIRSIPVLPSSGV